MTIFLDAGPGVGRVCGCAGRAEEPITAGQRPVFFTGRIALSPSSCRWRVPEEGRRSQSPQRHQGRHLLRPGQTRAFRRDAPRLG